jgi:hypothetical protein
LKEVFVLFCLHFEVGCFKVDLEQKTLHHRKSGLTVPLPEADFSVVGWYLKDNWIDEESALTNPALGASWQLFAWFRLQGHMLRSNLIPKLNAPSSELALQDRVVTPRSRTPRGSPTSERFPSASPASDRMEPHTSSAAGTEGDRAARRQLDFSEGSLEAAIEQALDEGLVMNNGIVTLAEEPEDDPGQ